MTLISADRQRSEHTSRLLRQRFERLQEEGVVVSSTLADHERDYVKEHFKKRTPQERLEVLQSLSAEEQCAALERLPPERLQHVLRLLEAQERRAVLESLPAEERLAGLSPCPQPVEEEPTLEYNWSRARRKIRAAARAYSEQTHADFHRPATAGAPGAAGYCEAVARHLP